jgi:hypothetical protein
MIKIFKFKNWEIYLTLFLIPFLIQLNLPYLTRSLAPSAIFLLIWIWIISFWLFKLVGYFKTEYLEKIEIKLFNINLIVLNLIFLIVILVNLLMFYKDLPILKSAYELFSKVEGYIWIYVYLASITILVIASRIITAKKLQRKLSIQDYYKSAIAFFFLPIGIFWIQNKINKLFGSEEDTEKKNRGYVYIGVTLLLFIATIVSFNEKEHYVTIGNENSFDFKIDSALIENPQQQNDSIFNSMDDSAKADYIFN